MWSFRKQGDTHTPTSAQHFNGRDAGGGGYMLLVFHYSFPKEFV